jgi:hypothetical protein
MLVGSPLRDALVTEPGEVEPAGNLRRPLATARPIESRPDLMRVATCPHCGFSHDFGHVPTPTWVYCKTFPGSGFTIAAVIEAAPLIDPDRQRPNHPMGEGVELAAGRGEPS